jgi:hypothetical protein
MVAGKVLITSTVYNEGPRMTRFMTTPKGFHRIEFDEARTVAAMVGFDVMQRASAVRSCGPGCKYLANDKRYFVTTLLQHIDTMLKAGHKLPPRVLGWRKKARNAVEEYRCIEQRLGGFS